jgi:hypothetical protein
VQDHIKDAVIQTFREDFMKLTRRVLLFFALTLAFTAAAVLAQANEAARKFLSQAAASTASAK